MEKVIKSTATVVKHTGSHYIISELPRWELIPAVVRGKLRLSGGNTTNPIAVGDKVEYSVNVDENGKAVSEAVILSVYPRSNYVIRKSTNLSRQCHIIASNVDCAYLVVTIDRPETKWPFIDRFLVTCAAYRVPVKIVLNKIDLYREDPELMEKVELFHSIYEDAGYEIFDISVAENIGIDELRTQCQKGGISLFSGVSGVGKSSLIKALDPALEPKISHISEVRELGKKFAAMIKEYAPYLAKSLDAEKDKDYYEREI